MYGHPCLICRFINEGKIIFGRKIKQLFSFLFVEVYTILESFLVTLTRILMI